MATSILITFLVVWVTLLGSSCSVKADNILYPGESLNTNSYLTLDKYILLMQSDCNLVLYEVNIPVWASNTAGLAYYCYCTIQRVGNLVIYTQDKVPIWTSNDARINGNYVLVLQKDRNLVIYGPAQWSAGSYVRAAGDSAMDVINTANTINGNAGNILYPGESLATYPGQSRDKDSYLSLDKYVLRMERDCNLVLYDADIQVWASNTDTVAAMNCNCTIQRGVGYLVIYTPAGAAIWKSNIPRSGNENYILVLQKDRNLVIYGPTRWSAGSNDAVAFAMDVIDTTSSTTNHAVA